MQRLTFIPQLDSFRFLAVLLVIISHWLPAYDFLPLGKIGVTFFFVLSGFLITSNLLYLKQSITKKEISTAFAFKSFYFRRTLRIFPLYYFVIFVLLGLVPSVFMGYFPWYAAYAANILIFRTGSWPGMLSHFWSLGVEEQFYLLWPLIVFSVGWLRLKYMFPALILIGLVFKIMIYSFHWPYWSAFLPWGSFDSFGMGAILAYLPFTSYRSYAFEKIPFIPTLLLLAASCVIFHLLSLTFLFDLFFSGFSVLLIREAQKRYTGITGKILDLPFLQYLGKISYGLYVYHNLIPWLWRCLTGKENKYILPLKPLFTQSWMTKPVVSLIAESLLLVTIASLSWYLMEKPLNSFKNVLKQRPKPPLPATA